jgi:hypothetical protein
LPVVKIQNEGINTNQDGDEFFYFPPNIFIYFWLATLAFSPFHQIDRCHYLLIFVRHRILLKNGTVCFVLSKDSTFKILLLSRISSQKLNEWVSINTASKTLLCFDIYSIHQIQNPLTKQSKKWHPFSNHLKTIDVKFSVNVFPHYSSKQKKNIDNNHIE